MKKLRQYIGIFIGGILLFFLINPFVQTHSELKNVVLQVQWLGIVLSFGIQILYRTLYIFPFANLLSALTRKKISFRCAFTLFHLSNITRYLPGRIWGVVRLLSLSHRFGLRKTVVGSSLTLHVSIEAALGGLIASSLLFSGQIRATVPEVLEKVPGHTLFLILPVVGLLIGILFLIFKVTKQVWTSVKKCLHLLGNAPLWRNVISCHVLLWGCQGLAFFLFIRSFFPVAWTEAAVLTACYAFAWIVGFLSFLTPGGLGVREGLLSLLLASYMPLSQATLVALFYRVWILSTEIILAGVALFLYKKRG